MTSDPDGAEPLEGVDGAAEAQPEPVTRAKSLTIGAVSVSYTHLTLPTTPYV